MSVADLEVTIFDTRLKEERDYWLKHLSFEREMSNVMLDHDRPIEYSPVKQMVETCLSGADFQKLVELTNRSPVLLNATLMAAVSIVLHKYTENRNVIVGSPVLKDSDGMRQRPNVLAIVNEVHGRMSFRQLLLKVRETLFEAYARPRYPFNRLVNDLKLENGNRCALFDCVLMIRDLHTTLPEIRNDITLIFGYDKDSLSGFIEFNPQLFERSSIERFGQHLCNTLHQALHNIDTHVSQFNLLTEAERQEILVDWNNTETVYPQSCMHQLFEEQATRTPEAIAVKFLEERLTYRELNVRSNQLAHYLQRLGVGPEARVGVYVERSVSMVVALLAILKAGAAYVPLDTTYPEMRLRFMLEDARIAVLITQPGLADNLPDCDAKIIRPEGEWEVIAHESQANPAPEISPDNLCYVIYTSGSTGRPKGVMISHRGLTNYLKWCTNAYRVAKGGGAPIHSPIGADLTITGLFAPLLVGRSITLVPEGHGVQALSEALQAEKDFSLTKITPAHLEVLSQLIDAEQAAGQTRALIIGGEALRGEQLSFWQTHAPTTRLINEYGPTETVVGCCVYEVPLGTLISGPVSIGRPIANTQLYILDQYLHPGPVGVTGELYIGGAGLGRGYLGQPELTAERFVPNNFGKEPGTRLYKTGDLVRYLPDGNIEFLKRNDHQVKIRGHRIELREVEIRLNQHPLLREGMVLAKESKNGEKRLVSYMISKSGTAPSVGELRGFLAESLPEHMIPSAYVFMDAFPLTPNGKVDHQALTLPEPHGSGSGNASSMPGTPIEEVVIGIWSVVLGVEQIGVDDNFLELGGHSLLATQVVSRIREAFQIELSLRDLFESPTVAQLAHKIDAAIKADNGLLISHIEPAPRTENLPLSFAQRRLWFLDQLEPGGSAFNITSALRLTGKLNISALERSVSELVRRHETLRTTFQTLNGELVQVIAPAQQVRIAIVDLSDMSKAECLLATKRHAAEEAHRPFALNQDPPWRVRLLRLGAEEHVLLFTMHHIVSDGWSMNILTREVSALYQAYAAGRESALAGLPIQYADYAVWQRQWLQGEVLEEQLGYWRKQLAGAPAVLELPTDHSRPAQQSHRGAHLPFQLSAELTAGLKQLNQREGMTLFMSLLAGWQLLLARYSRQPDVVVGSPVANRTRAEVEGLIGFFVNTLVLRTEVAGELRVRELLQRVREVCLGAYAHQEVPFEMLVEQLQPERNMSHTPLFQVMLVLQNAPPQQSVEWAGVEMRALELESGTAKYDLTLGLAESERGLVGTLEYNRDLYERESMERLVGHYQQVLSGLVEKVEQRVWEVRLLSEAEEAQVLRQANESWVEYESEASLTELFERQVERTPEAIAVVYEEQQLSYQELNARANQLAHYLRSRGVRPESLVALVLERSVEMVVAVLGVLKAGGAYLPVDPAYPEERVRFMLEDAGATVVLTSGVEGYESSKARVVRLAEAWQKIATEPEANLASVTAADNLAYVIYTSGSTGRPKGVYVTNRNLIHSTTARFRYYEQPVGTFLLLSSFAFDSSVAGIFWTVCQGGALVLPPQGIERDPSTLRSLITQHQVTDMLCLPSLYALLLDQSEPEQLASLRSVIVAGESCPAELIATHYELLDQAALFNEYGPTEGTVWSTVARFKPETLDVTIGSHITNVCVYVLDQHLSIVPIGVGGEIFIGGEGLARGYMNRPELTAERFIPNPFSRQPGARLYRTGDLARHLPDGDLILLGRNDDQVKLRGYRIELNEIEAVMMQHPGVREVVVMCREDAPNDKRIVAYLVPTKESAPSTSDLRNYLRAELPAYMVPSVFVTLNELPFGPNGKVDRQALPAPEGTRPELNILYAAPQTLIEKRLAEIWGNVLNVERIGRDDNFFDLGGHSFLVVKVHERIRQELQVEIPLIKLFEFPTIYGLSQFLENQQSGPISAEESQAWASRRRQALQRQRQAVRN